ncbi:MAG TPA: hypothetical protein VNW94_22075 [Streptosporangiaceae bacterium]|nr:hypothetical protein [Streptosporangiaceae bacterium]
MTLVMENVWPRAAAWAGGEHVPRPPVIAVRDGSATIVVRGETEEDLLRLYPR